MRAGGDGEELGQPLDESEDEGFKPRHEVTESKCRSERGDGHGGPPRAVIKWCVEGSVAPPEDRADTGVWQEAAEGKRVRRPSWVDVLTGRLASAYFAAGVKALATCCAVARRSGRSSEEC
ncbi:hypothetical protein GCM10010251_50010 [Streptomyces aurantiogriseus]|uniref:Uncharacterized protein n=1 Tax=Streptomyces aurantiogriseus TaxID=66870 RepID=A0A918CJ64_9ACTN|nr:hypothetical protein GCM10010251_50010 [Streptomyces aurantiogriseus]